jgi:hypothetical protein
LQLPEINLGQSARLPSHCKDCYTPIAVLRVRASEIEYNVKNIKEVPT